MMVGPVNLRTVTASDRAAVLEVVREAFTDDERDASEELDIVRSTWASGRAAFELRCAVVDGAVVGHVLAAEGDLGGRAVVAVAPLAVSPAHQGAGVGTALMTELLGLAEAARLPMVVLLGDPAYYSRFGFEPSGPLGITYEPVGPNWPALPGSPGSRPTSRRSPGTFRYIWEFAGGLGGEAHEALSGSEPIGRT